MDVVEGVRDGRIDFGIVREDAVPSNLPKARLVKVQFHICASRRLLRGRFSRSLDQPAVWARLPFVAGDGRGQFDQRLRTAMVEACGTFRPVFECDSLLQVHEMIVQGLAAGVLPSIGIRGLAENDVIVRPFAPLEDYGRHQVLHWNERQMRRRGVDASVIRAMAKVIGTS
jgi:DNA-binding transcriptional LysR family regulator